MSDDYLKPEKPEEKPIKAKLTRMDRVRFCVHSGLLAAATQMGGVMANADYHSINLEILAWSTIVTFIMHYSKESINFIKDKSGMI